MEQRKKIPSSILVFEKEGINLVPFLANGRGFDYAFYYDNKDEYSDCSTMGYLSKSKYKSLEEFKAKSQAEEMEKIAKAKEEIDNRSYYDQTTPLAREFESIRQALKAFDNLKSKKSLAKMANDPSLKAEYEFMAKNPNLFVGYKKYMDIRFNTIISATNDQINISGEKTLKAETFECNPKATFAEFTRCVETGFVFLKTSVYYDFKEIIELMEGDYNSFLEKARQLLKVHPKVGLVGHGKSSRNWPHFCPESKPIPIGAFTIDDYLTAKNDCIYWFK